MKLDTIQRVHNPEEAHELFKALWKTDIFKNAHARKGSFVHKIIEKAGEYPFFTYEMSETDDPALPPVEKAHFSAWWRGLSHREYDNPYMHDLYHFHEVYHMAVMPYITGMKPGEFMKIIGENETDASVTSEIMPYLWFPELRKLVFTDRKILADRFLEDPKFMEMWNNGDKDTCYRIVRSIHYLTKKGICTYDAAMSDYVDKIKDEWLHDRRANWFAEIKDFIDGTHTYIYDPAHPERKPLIEFAGGFNDQNRAWKRIWTESGVFDDIERHIKELQVATDADRGNRNNSKTRLALHRYLKWLTSPEVTEGTDIPFYRQAYDFRDAYMKRSKKYTEVVKQSRLPNNSESSLSM